MKCRPYLSTHLWETTRSPLFSPLKISSFFCLEVNKLSEQLGFMEEGSWSCDKALQAVTYTCVWGFNFIALKILIWSHFRIGYFKGCTVRIPSRLPMQPYNFFPMFCSLSFFFFFPPLSSLLTGKHQRDFHTPKWVVLQYSVKVTVKSQSMVDMCFHVHALSASTWTSLTTHDHLPLICNHNYSGKALQKGFDLNEK